MATENHAQRWALLVDGSALFFGQKKVSPDRNMNYAELDTVLHRHAHSMFFEGRPAPLDLEQLWIDMIDGVSRISSFAKAYIIKTHPVSLADGCFTLGLDPKFQDEFSML